MIDRQTPSLFMYYNAYTFIIDNKESHTVEFLPLYCYCFFVCSCGGTDQLRPDVHREKRTVSFFFPKYKQYDLQSFRFYASYLPAQLTNSISLPKKYLDFVVVFEDKETTVLSSYWTCDCAINLKSEAQILAKKQHLYLL